MIKLLHIINRIYNALISTGVTILLARKELARIKNKSGIRHDCNGIHEWKKKWRGLGWVNPDYYRVFSQYCGEDVNIVPDDICHNVIEPILNPRRFISTYEDKCLFDKFLKSSFINNITPFTYFRCINGVYFDVNYDRVKSLQQVIDNIPVEVDRLVIKKSIDSSSGNGIVFIVRDCDSKFRDIKTDEIISEEYLFRNFGHNFLIQEVVKQSSFMSQFCPTSVNTIRVAVYRSLKNNKPVVINSIIRIGKDGSLVDNAHAGGLFVGLDENGKIGNYCCNQFGEKFSVFNNVDFASRSLILPDYQEIKVFAERVADAIPHHRLIAMDIMIDSNNKPILLEYNIRGFSVWLFQFTNGTGFGHYTEEIIDYCKAHKSEATRVSVIF